jgi:hypothetical protein
MNEFDKRQLNIMIQKIHSFNEGHLHLSDLIYDLEALLNILTNQDQPWKATFRGYWWNLEQVYAFALYEEKSRLDSEDQKIVNDTIEDLKSLIYTKLYCSKQEIGKALMEELNK